MPKVVFVLEGHLRHGFAGQAEGPVGPGDVVINLSGYPESYEPPEPGIGGQLRVLRLTFDAGFLAVGGATSAAELGLFLRQRLPAVGRARLEGFTRTLPDLRAALTLPDARLRVNALARCVLLDLAVAWPGSGGNPDADPAADRLAARVENFLEARLREPLRLADVARAVDRSEEHVVREFRRQRGTTVFTHLRRLRVERAKYLLLCTGHPVGRVAGETGFATLAHFSRCFRQDTGVSPSDYRARGGRSAVPA